MTLLRKLLGLTPRQVSVSLEDMRARKVAQLERLLAEIAEPPCSCEG